MDVTLLIGSVFDLVTHSPHYLALDRVSATGEPTGGEIYDLPHIHIRKATTLCV